MGAILNAATVTEQRRSARRMVLAQTAQVHADPANALERLDPMRWLDGVGYHSDRIWNCLAGALNRRASIVPVAVSADWHGSPPQSNERVRLTIIGPPGTPRVPA